MIESSAGSTQPSADDEITLVNIAIIALRWRRTIIGLALAGGILGLAIGLTSQRMYRSSAIFIPQSSEGGATALSAAASQFGIRIPTGGGGGWGLPVYVELLGSSALLEPIATDTVVVDESGRRAAVMDLLKVRDPNPAKRRELGVQALSKVISATEVRPLEAVRLSVTTPWPKVSFTLTQRLLDGLNHFILEKRKSQAVAELQFVEVQARNAEVGLRSAEDRLQYFLQQNRSVSGSPELSFERDRLQRALSLQQQLYGNMLQAREEARIREVRDTPVITVIEDPRLPVVGEARNSVQKGVLGGLAGTILGAMVALLGERLAQSRNSPSERAGELLALVRSATPRFLKRRTAR